MIHKFMIIKELGLLVSWITPYPCCHTQWVRTSYLSRTSREVLKDQAIGTILSLIAAGNILLDLKTITLL